MTYLCDSTVAGPDAGETMHWQANANTPLPVIPLLDVPDRGKGVCKCLQVLARIGFPTENGWGGGQDDLESISTQGGCQVQHP